MKDKADYSHDYDKMGSLKYQIDMLKKRGTAKNDTFGTSFSRYEKTMVPGMKNHYWGKGQSNKNGIGEFELQKAEVHVRSSCSRVPDRTNNRGLLSPSAKQIRTSNVGPGSYEDETQQAFKTRTAYKAKPNGFGTATRDTAFSKYSALHSALVSKGLH